MTVDLDAQRIELEAARLLEAGGAAESRQLLRRCVSVHPGYAPCWNRLGLAQIALGETSSARTSWQRAVQLDPHFIEARINLGHLTLRSGAKESALEQFERIVADAPDAVSAWEGLGEAALAAGALPLARDSYTRALRLAPGTGSYWVGLGSAHLLMDQFEEARAALARAVALESENTVARLLRSVAVAVDGSVSRGLEEAERELAEAEAPGSLEAAAYALGVLRARQRRHADAVVCFRRALELNPANHRARYRLARALLAAGRRHEGRRELQRFQYLASLNREITVLRERLKVEKHNSRLRRRLLEIARARRM